MESLKVTLQTGRVFKYTFLMLNLSPLRLNFKENCVTPQQNILGLWVVST
jgi:hypothetical protein